MSEYLRAKRRAELGALNSMELLARAVRQGFRVQNYSQPDLIRVLAQHEVATEETVRLLEESEAPESVEGAVRDWMSEAADQEDDDG